MTAGWTIAVHAPSFMGVLSFAATVEELLIIAGLKRAPTSTATMVDALGGLMQSGMVQSISRPRTLVGSDEPCNSRGDQELRSAIRRVTRRPCQCHPGPPRVRGRADLDRPGGPAGADDLNIRGRSRERPKQQLSLPDPGKRAHRKHVQRARFRNILLLALHEQLKDRI